MKLVYHFCKKKKGFTLGSKLIMLVQGTDFSHCAIEVIRDEQEPVIYEAVFPKSHCISKSQWLEHFQEVHKIEQEIKSFDVLEVEKALAEGLNVPYSVFQLVIIAIGLTLKAMLTAVQLFCLNSKKEEVCSEYMAKVMTAKGYEFKKNADNIDIVDCYNAAKEMKGIE
jgi:hypothetical protein